MFGVATMTSAIRLLLAMTCGRDQMKKYMQFRSEPRKSPSILSLEEIAELLASVPGPGLKFRAARPSATPAASGLPQ